MSSKWAISLWLLIGTPFALLLRNKQNNMFYSWHWEFLDYILTKIFQKIFWISTKIFRKILKILTKIFRKIFKTLIKIFQKYSKYWPKYSKNIQNIDQNIQNIDQNILKIFKILTKIFRKIFKILTIFIVRLFYFFVWTISEASVWTILVMVFLSILNQMEFHSV